MNTRRRTRLGLLLAFAMALAAASASAPAVAGHGVTSESPVMWEWDDSTVVGVSQIVRTDSGIEARLRTSGLTPGDTVTLWIATFNNPAACSATPCARPADVRNPDTRADLFWLDGAVVGPDGTATFDGRVAVGQTDYSLKAEVGIVEAVPLEDPYTAEVALALHSHGPVQPGEILRAQLTSFLGGCEVLTGIDGFAQGPDDMPDEIGECTTFQKSVHLP